MNQETLARLVKIAEQKIWGDDSDFDPNDASSLYAAYEGGFEDGQTSLARMVLNALMREHCGGSCGEHIGEAVLVRVHYGAHNWGYFYYCKTAIAEDIKRGFTVEIVESLL